MTQIFLHRQNNISAIVEDGIEIDVRSSINGLVLNHDRLNHGATYPLLKDKLQFFKKDKKIILNIKESGIEEELIDLMEDLELDYYFLDSQIPDVLRLCKKFTSISHRFIIRVSDVEYPTTTMLSIVNPSYMWLDYAGFGNFDPAEYKKFIRRIVYLMPKYQRFIVVSPELYSVDYLEYVSDVKKIIRELVPVFSVCTKYPEDWRTCE